MRRAAIALTLLLAACDSPSAPSAHPDCAELQQQARTLDLTARSLDAQHAPSAAATRSHADAIRALASTLSCPEVTR